MKYKLIDHTADLGIRVFGKSAEELFENAAFALFDLITDTGVLAGDRQTRIQVTGADRPDLMVNWLRELLYLWNGTDRLVKTVSISALSETGLTAGLTYDLFSPERHDIRAEIKAVTYHQIQVSGGSSGWEAKIIFDV